MQPRIEIGIIESMSEWSNISRFCVFEIWKKYKTSRYPKCRELQSMHSVSQGNDAVYIPEDHRSHDHTQLYTIQEHSYTEFKSLHSRLLLVGFMLLLLGVPFGKSLLPDLTGSFLVEVGEE